MTEEQQELRVRLPRDKEMFGVVVGELGGARFACICADGKERICRIPGRLRRRVWVREGDYVLLVPWEVEGDKRGDIVWRYKKLEVEWLRKKGYLKDL